MAKSRQIRPRCPHCNKPGWSRIHAKHTNRCGVATPPDRRFYQEHGYWPYQRGRVTGRRALLDAKARGHVVAMDGLAACGLEVPDDAPLLPLSSKVRTCGKCSKAWDDDQ